MDGTLIKTDVLWESLVRLVKRNPAYLLMLPVWLAKGRANLKRQIASRVEVDATLLPYHAGLVGWLSELRAAGRPLILATAADRALANRVAEHLGLFSDVMGSDGETNLRGGRKAEALVKRFGERGYDYAGDSHVDLPVWRQAHAAVVVGRPGGALETAAGKVTSVARTFPAGPPKWRMAVKALRPHQWSKNLIIFIPLLASHQMGRLPLLVLSVKAFVAFCATASSVYVVNDLLDLESDRRHARKCRRPFASGDLPISWGLVMAPALIVTGFAIAFTERPLFQCVLLGYLLLSTAYSHGGKQAPLLDVFMLATLYTVRLIAGHAATGIVYSNWLFMFSMFIFLSLALAKRFVEISSLPPGVTLAHGRGYKVDDAPVLSALGIGNGLLAALVFALYANSTEVTKLYRNPGMLLLMCPLILYWISRVWLLAHRGKLHDDPVVFALKDNLSYLLAVLALVVIWIAAGHGGHP
jgi:4-hydroxybenzoate polyprenyltransferase/phosphoserine phosphatase